MSRLLDDLDPIFRPLAMQLLARCVEADLLVRVIDTRRSLAEHRANLAAGRSWTKRSKHVDGLAIDVCPYVVYQLHGPDKLQWDAADPAWTLLGAIGEALGLRWGGRWTQRDMGHFEYVGVPGGEVPADPGTVPA